MRMLKLNKSCNYYFYIMYQIYLTEFDKNQNSFKYKLEFKNFVNLDLYRIRFKFFFILIRRANRIFFFIFSDLRCLLHITFRKHSRYCIL